MSAQPPRGPDFALHWRGPAPDRAPEPASAQPVVAAPVAAEPPVRLLPRRGYRQVWTAVVALALTFGVANLAMEWLSSGTNTLFVAATLAVIPGALVTAAYLWLDRHEPEPGAWLAFAFVWGACVATFLAGLANGLAVELFGGTQAAKNTVVTTTGPIVEELLKAAGLFIIVWKVRDEFDGVVDGVVYAGLVGIGFAVVENVSYFAEAFTADGPGGLAAVFVLRGVFSPFAHSLFTMATGVGIGLMAVSRSPIRGVFPVVGLVVAIAGHALWNTAAVLEQFGPVYVLVLAPTFFGAVAMAVVARRREGRVIHEQSQRYAQAGWFGPGEVAMVSTGAARRAARRWAVRHLPPQHRGSVATFQRLMGDLAMLRRRMDRGTAPVDAMVRERQLLDEMISVRQGAMAALAVGGQTPTTGHAAGTVSSGNG